MMKPRHHIFAMRFAKVYPLYVQKAERKNRTKDEVDHIICWLTGYDQAGLQQQIDQQNDFETFFAQAPAIHPNSALIKGVVCGVRIEDLDDPLMRNIRYLDKLIDELAKGRPMEKILRKEGGRLAARIVGVAVVTSVLLLQSALDAGQRIRIEQSVDLLVPSVPVVLDVGGTRHLIYELHITNMRPHPLSVERLQVTTPTSVVPLVDLRDRTLRKTMARVGAPRDAPDTHVIGPGQRAVAYFWIPLRETAPTAVAHRLEIGAQGTPSGTPIVVDSAQVLAPPTDAIALDPPLAGGPWIAIYDPELMGGHRTAIYTIAGRARIPGRFAIDWIRAPSSPDAPSADGFDPTRNGFGAPVLAVADARVAQVVDGMPDLPAGAMRPNAPVPHEQASGNCVVLELGGGRFAFYEHLRRGSITVTAGQRVRVGQVIAQVGSSGSTSIGAHLHFHVADTSATLASEGVPFVFRRVEHRGAYRSRAALTGGESWAASGANGGVRRFAYPAPLAVLQF